MVKIVILILLMISLHGCVLTPSRPPTPPSTPPASGYTQVHEKIIAVDEGSFLVKDLSIIQDRLLGPKVVGNIVNKTNKDWIQVRFEVEVYDQAGNRLATTPFTILSLKKDEAKPIGILGDGEPLYSLPDSTRISSLDLRLKGGEYPAEYVFVLVKPKESRDLSFSDGQLDIRFSPSREQIGFNLTNKTANPIKIDWNNLSYVDVLSQSHKVMHSGTKYIDRDKPQASTVIPPGASINDIVFPTDYVSYTSGRYGGWTEERLFPQAPDAKNYKGRSFSVFMPLEVSESIKNYHFVFKIEDVLM